MKPSGTAATELPLILNSLRNNIRGEAGHRIIKRKELLLDNPGGRVAGMGDRGGELLSKICVYLFVKGEAFGGKADGLIGGGLPLRDLNMLHRREGLDL